MQLDTIKAQYAWYVRNCARGADAPALRGILMHQLPRLDKPAVTKARDWLPDAMLFPTIDPDALKDAADELEAPVEDLPDNEDAVEEAA